MALRHWFVVLFVVPVIAGGSFVASSSAPVRRLLGLDPGAELMTALLVWAYALCEPGTHDMCLR